MAPLVSVSNWIQDRLNLLAAKLLHNRGLSKTQYFCLRQLLHLLGGATIALIFMLIHVSVLIGVAWTVLAASIIYKEAKEAAHQPLYKTIIDACAWLSGFIVTVLILK